MPVTKQDIDAQNKELDALLAKAESHIHDFIKATARAVKEQAIPIAKAIGKAQAAKSAKLGQDGLRKLLAEIAQYTATLDELSEKCIYKKSAWYTLALKDEVKYVHHPRASDYLSAPLDAGRAAPHVLDVLLPLVEILSNHGFSMKTKQHTESWYHAVWEAFSWSANMNRALSAYNDTDRAAHKVFQVVEDLKGKKLKEEAASLWDSVP